MSSSSSSASSSKSDISISSISSNESTPSIPTRGHTNLLHVNAQSLKFKIPVLASEVKDFDIVCVSETWLNPNINDSDILLDGFHHPIRHDRNDGYGGVAIYTRDYLIEKHRQDLELPGLESAWVEIHNGNLPIFLNRMFL